MINLKIPSCNWQQEDGVQNKNNRDTVYVFMRMGPSKGIFQTHHYFLQHQMAFFFLPVDHHTFVLIWALMEIHIL